MNEYVTKARQYVEDVLTGVVPACLYIRQACERSRKDLERQNTEGFPYYFDEVRAARVCSFIERLPHIQGPLAGQCVHLENWQCWLLTELFGWLRVGSGARRYRRVLCEMGRGNGKSLLASGVALYCAFCEGEGGADCICTATVEQQARLVLDCARNMMIKSEELAERLGIKVTRHEVVQESSNSRLRALPGKGATIEGTSLHLGVCDEIWAQKGRDIVDALSTGTAKRAQSLLFMITTAGRDASGVCFEIHDFVVRLLAGDAVDESFFGAIFTVDPTDQWDSIAAAQKANPNWGVSVAPSVIEEEMKRAQQIPSQQQTYRAKYLCEWVLNGGEEPFVDPLRVRACYQQDLDAEQFKGQPCVYGLDLASRLDLCSAVRVHARRIDGKVHYYAFCRSWLPSGTVDASKNASYRGWAARGDLVVTPGTITDLDTVENFLLNEVSTYKVRDIGFDPLQSNQLVSHLKKKAPSSVVFAEVAQFAKYLTQGMQELEEVCADGRLHTSSAPLLWCLQNLRAKYVGMGLVYPCRPKDRVLKIDSAVALVMALRSVHVTPLDESKRPPRIITISY
jgi:phage terminase large subunit-like protein